MAQFELLTAHRDIRAAQRKFEKALDAALPRRPGRYTVGYPGGKIDDATLQSNGLIWHYRQILNDAAIPRYWNAFGLVETLATNRSNSITVEINSPLDGANGSVAGLFARDQDGGFAVLHSGKIGGGKKGVGKAEFVAALQEKPIFVVDPTHPNKTREVFLLARLDDPRAIHGVTRFVVEVARFKDKTDAEEAEALSTKVLRDRAEANTGKPKRVLREVAVFERNEYVTAYAKRRANGRCDLCGERAPFEVKGVPFLECHHILPLADNGDDTIANAVALCPNCHRRMHMVHTDADLKALRRKADT
jgi:5-methylcytosine-specific restriction protein A